MGPWWGWFGQEPGVLPQTLLSLPLQAPRETGPRDSEWRVGGKVGLDCASSSRRFQLSSKLPRPKWA